MTGASDRQKRNKGTKGRAKQRKQMFKIDIKAGQARPKKHWAKTRAQLWRAKIKALGTAASKEELRKQKAAEFTGYKHNHILGLPREIRQEILLHIFPHDVLISVPNSKLQNYCQLLASTHSIMRDDMPFVYKQLEKKRVRLVEQHEADNKAPKKLIDELLKPLIKARLAIPILNRKKCPVMTLRKERRFRAQRCWHCGCRHYDKTIVCRPYVEPDDLGGWGRSYNVFAPHQLERIRVFER